MKELSSLPRRRLLQASMASLAVGALSSPSLARARTSIDLSVAIAARSGLERAGDRVPRRDVVGVADFSQPSRVPRLHLVDMERGTVDTLLVAHGRGSDPEKTGWLSRFSNAPGSDATSEGAFVTSNYYLGGHGPSMRLVGLDPTNSNAEERRIVVHGAWYVGPQMIREFGMLGRSEGCFAVNVFDLPQVLDRLGPGRLLVAARL